MGSNRDAALEALEKGLEERGFITYDEVSTLFEGADDQLAETDALCMSLLDLGIEVVSEAPVEEDPVAEAQLERELAQLALTPDLGEQLERYIANIRQFPVLTARDEVDLGKAIAQGLLAQLELENAGLSRSRRTTLQARVQRGETARRRFIEGSLCLVAHVAWPYRHDGVPLADLMQEGSLGLITAIDRWDYRRGCRFSTCAVWWIREYILRAIDDSTLIRLPPPAQEDRRKAAQAANGLGATPDAPPTVAQIAEALGMSPERVSYVLHGLPTVRNLESLPCWTGRAGPCKTRGGDRWVLACRERDKARPPLSLGDPDDDSEPPPCLGAGFEAAAPGVADCFDDVVQGGPSFLEELLWRGEAPAGSLLRETLQCLLDTLTSDQRRVLTLRYGLGSKPPKSVGQISRHFRVPEKRIREIEAEALRNLRHPARSRKLKHYLR